MKADETQTVIAAAEKAIYKAIGMSKGSRHHAATVQDLIQETFVKVLINYDPERGSLGAIAYTAARNLALDFTRGRSVLGAEHKGVSSLTVSDESGADVTMDIGDATPSAFDLIAMRERDAGIAAAMELLPESGKRAIDAMLADETAMSGGDRIAKMRAIDTLQEHVKSPGYVARTIAKRVKAPADPKVVEAKPEGAPQLGLSVVSRWNYQANMMGVPTGITRIYPEAQAA